MSPESLALQQIPYLLSYQGNHHNRGMKFHRRGEIQPDMIFSYYFHPGSLGEICGRRII